MGELLDTLELFILLLLFAKIFALLLLFDDDDDGDVGADDDNDSIYTRLGQIALCFCIDNVDVFR
jgi:hypothetical protein